MTYYEICHADLPDEPPIAITADYPTAMRAVAELHARFRDQLEANGEGVTRARQRLSVTAVSDCELRTLCTLSTASSHH